MAGRDGGGFIKNYPRQKQIIDKIFRDKKFIDEKSFGPGFVDNGQGWFEDRQTKRHQPPSTIFHTRVGFRRNGLAGMEVGL